MAAEIAACLLFAMTTAEGDKLLAGDKKSPEKIGAEVKYLKLKH